MMNNIQLIVYDFDGVMTDNTVTVDQNGKESVRVNRADGLAIGEIKKRGIGQIILSTEANSVVRARAKKLKLPVIDDCRDKKEALVAFCELKRIELKNVLYVGNDINDLSVMGLVGLRACPADADKKIRKISEVRIKAKGGEGVVRELVEILGII